MRFEIGIAPQDENRLTRNDLQIICRQFAKSMGLTDSQRNLETRATKRKKILLML
ncbi:MAG: hypothetical protein LBS69_11630 [Prevotellaceae bacterium]|nr:hypothetical protein [Prevotellaceae bacterium]